MFESIKETYFYTPTTFFLLKKEKNFYSTPKNILYKNAKNIFTLPTEQEIKFFIFFWYAHNVHKYICK